MAGNGQFFFSQVIRWGVEVICSGVGLGLDFDVAVYIFRGTTLASNYSSDDLPFPCARAGVLDSFFSVWCSMLSFSCLYHCRSGGLHLFTSPSSGLLLLLPHCQAGSGGW